MPKYITSKDYTGTYTEEFQEKGKKTRVKEDLKLKIVDVLNINEQTGIADVLITFTIFTTSSTGDCSRTIEKQVPLKFLTKVED